MQIDYLPEHPFPGIEPFGYADRNIFFARENEIRNLNRLIVLYRGVLLYSTSGVGKSSLINAGIIPQSLNEGYQPERIRVQPKPDEEIIVERISERFKGEPPFLPSILITSKEQERAVFSVKEFLDRLQRRSKKVHPLLIFDQFEEWITLFEESSTKHAPTGSKKSQQEIQDLLITILNDEILPVKVLLVLREDYLAKLDPIFKQCPNLPDQYLRLIPLNSDQIFQVIRGPFEQYPGKYFPEISITLAKEIQRQFKSRTNGSPLSLTEVQIVCQSLSEKTEKGVNLDHVFTDWGEVKGILEMYLEDALKKLDTIQLDPAIGLLSCMITRDGTRNVISGDDLIVRVQSEENISQEILSDTLESLEQKTRLVRRERRREVYYYEIVSEFLVDWIQKKKQKRKERLESLKHLEALKLEEAQKEAELQARVARRFRRLFIVIAFVSILVFVAAFFAIIQTQVANWAKREAKRQEAIAKESEARALEAAKADSISRIKAEIERAKAEFERARADSIRLLAQEAAILAQKNAELANAAANGELIARTEAEKARQKAIEKQNEIEKLRISSLALTLAVDVQRELPKGNAELAALLSRQAYLFDLRTGRKYQSEVYESLRRSLDSLSIDEKKTLGGPSILEGHTDWVRCVVTQPGGNLFATGSSDGTVKLWYYSLDNFETLSGHLADVRSLAFSPDGQFLASGSDDQTIRLWDLRKQKSSFIELKEHQAGVWALAFSHDGKKLASADANGKIVIWDWNENNPVKIFTLEDPSRVRAVAFSPNDRMLASGDDSGIIRLWQFDSSNPEPVLFAKIAAHNGSVRSVAFNRTGEILASGGSDAVLSLWSLNNNASSYSLLRELRGHEGPINAVAFSQNGELLASGSSDQTVRLWELKSLDRNPIVMPDHDGWVLAVAFSPSGNTLIAGTAFRTIYTWITQANILAELVCQNVTRNLTKQEWYLYIGGNIPYESTCTKLPGK